MNIRLALVAALLGLAACTGTQELPNPNLLVTGYQTPAQGGARGTDSGQSQLQP